MDTSIDTSMDRLALHSRSPYRQKVPPPPTACCIYPYSVDKLRLINVPRNLLPAFRIAVQTSWTRGIQSEGMNDTKTCYEVKLKGYPWPMGAQKSAIAVESCRLTTSIMRFMLSHGWGLELSTHLQFKNRQDCWFFRKKAQETHVVMCGVSFSSQDKIRVVDGSPEVTQAVKSTIENHWDKGLQQHSLHCEAEEFRLKGRPWTCRHDKRQAYALLMYLIDELKSARWILYASVGTGTSWKGGAEMDTWILKKSKP
ncbi:unnamed protein product [Calypogeia fissa]